MADIIEITDIKDPALDVYVRLTEAQLRRKIEPAKGIFIAESPKVIESALKAGLSPVSFLMERRHIEGQAKELIGWFENVPVYTGSRELLRSITGYELTRGVLCALRRPELPCVEALLQNAKRVAVLEGIVDTTNIGAIFRSAAALGIDAVLLTPTSCDPLNRRAVRVSMGTVFNVPWTYIGNDAADWPQKGLEALKAAGFKTAAMALSEYSVGIDDERVKGEEKLAIILGTEGDGLKSGTIAKSDYTVKIPMAHGVDSLNVAAASAVAFWELRAR